jgi:hypothetical protein
MRTRFQVEGTLVGHGVYTLERPFGAWLSKKKSSPLLLGAFGNA